MCDSEQQKLGHTIIFRPIRKIHDCLKISLPLHWDEHVFLRNFALEKLWLGGCFLSHLQCWKFLQKIYVTSSNNVWNRFRNFSENLLYVLKDVTWKLLRVHVPMYQFINSAINGFNIVRNQDQIYFASKNHHKI